MADAEGTLNGHDAGGQPAERLAPRQARFVDEYLIDLNATQAAIRAGYSPKTAEVQGPRLLGNVRVAAAIQRGRAGLAAKAKMTAMDVRRELECLATSDIGDLFDCSGPVPRLKALSDIPERARRALASVRVKRQIEGQGEQAREVEIIDYKFWSKDAALEKLGRHLGLFIDRSEVTVRHVDVLLEAVLGILRRYVPRDELRGVVIELGKAVDQAMGERKTLGARSWNRPEPET